MNLNVPYIDIDMMNLKGRRNILGAGEIVECDSLRRPYDGRGGGDKNVSIL